MHRTVEQGDTVVVHFTHRGTRTSQIMGLAPTYRPFAYEHIHILRFAGGRAVEHWGVHDHLSFMRQVGAAPAAAGAAAR